MDAGEAATHEATMHAEAVAEALRECSGVVLAGGRSSRMGRDKAALELDGEPLLARVVGRLRAALPVVVVIGPARLHALVPGVPVVPDEYPGAGPLGGLVTALRVVSTSRVFLAGCDMPFVAPGLVRAMALLAAEEPETDAVLLHSPAGAGLEYLHGVYTRSCLCGRAAAARRRRAIAAESGARNKRARGARGGGAALRPLGSERLQREHAGRAAAGKGACR